MCRDSMIPTMYRNCIFQEQAPPPTSMALLLLFSCWKVRFLLCQHEFLSISTVTAIDQTTLDSHPDNCSDLLTGLIASSFSVVK